MRKIYICILKEWKEYDFNTSITLYSKGIAQISPTVSKKTVRCINKIVKHAVSIERNVQKRRSEIYSSKNAGKQYNIVGFQQV